MRATCDAYAWGAVEGLTFMRKVDAELSKGTMARLLFCTPENITPQQISDVVKNYVRDHPEERSNTTSEMALIAMLRAFPCK